MRYLILISLLIASFQAAADDLACYSNGKLIYHAKVKNVQYNQGIFFFKESKSGKHTFISADCILNVPT